MAIDAGAGSPSNTAPSVAVSTAATTHTQHAHADQTTPGATQQIIAAGSSSVASQSKQRPQQEPPNPQNPSRKPNKKGIACRYIQQGKTCRAGNECRFLHDIGSTPAADKQKNSSKGNAGGSSKNKGRGKGKGKDKGGSAQRDDQIRKSQIEDMLKAPKWTVKRLSSGRGETALAVEMRPSDPDFPFDVSRLYFALVIPALYPATRTSDPVLEIQIANKNIPVGIKRNIEVGFAKYVRKTANAAIEAGSTEDLPSLEDYITWLDINLELMMQQKAAPTIKFASFGSSGKAAESPKDKARENASPSARTQQTTEDAAAAANDQAGSVNDRPESRISQASSSAALFTPPASRPAVGRPVRRPNAGDTGSTAEDSRRTAELRQLERRFRSSYRVVSESSGGSTTVQLDIQPTDPDIQGLDISQLTVTIDIDREYPQGSPAVAISVTPDSILGRKGKPSTWQPAEGRPARMEFVSQSFENHVATTTSMSLLHHLNWLDRQLVRLLTGPLPAPHPAQQPAKPVQSVHPRSSPDTPLAPKATSMFGADESEKPWIKTISAAEAGLPTDMASLNLSNTESDSFVGSDYSTSLSDSDDQPDAGAAHEPQDKGKANAASGFSRPARRGTEIRLGRITLKNVSLAHCHSLNLNVRCTRCKNSVELKGIVPTLQEDKDQQMWRACDSCTTILGVRFRPDWLFAGCTSLGFLDCSGCTPIDLLPSKFTLSCEACIMKDDEYGDGNGVDEPHRPLASTTATVGLNALSTASCKVCYTSLGIEMFEPQFVRLQGGLSLGGTASAANMISREVARTRSHRVNRREELARLGVIPGQPLPNHGACKHFSRSRRWLRFPCCGKAYPCVVCHDEKEDHDYEYAQVMICGNCAKEQRIAKAEHTGLCASCGFQVIKKIDGNNAFWQGGTGVRDRNRMNRKDSKKYQGLGKTVAHKNVATPKKKD
ncbi:hypothetical protein GGI07_000599 [Coemansia sp. Benny D115]|nr:hypothetical protein GGI07_000599 [Coemansia sp. Benny D115]